METDLVPSAAEKHRKTGTARVRTYGLDIVDPSWFLPASCLICAIVATTIGSSWTTAATVGVALMGIGGAFLTLAHQNIFLIDVIGGRGWVAIAMVIFGNWDPLKGAVGALIFGFLDGLQLRLQGLGIAFITAGILSLGFMGIAGIKI